MIFKYFPTPLMEEEGVTGGNSEGTAAPNNTEQPEGNTKAGR